MFDSWVEKIPWRREWQPTPYSCLENSIHRKTWWATVHKVTKSWTQVKRLSMHVWVLMLLLFSFYKWED